MVYCKNCNHQFENKFCPNCGLPSKLKRIDGTYFNEQIQSLINFEKGFFYTVKELILRPGETIQEFLFENRRKHIKPLVFLIFTSIIFTLITYLFGIEYNYFNVNNITILQDHVNTGSLGDWLNKNIGYTNLIMGCFIALWIKVFFKKQDYNLYEIIVMLCFVLGEATLILSLAFAIGVITKGSIITVGFMLLFVIYITWAIGQFFGKHSLMNYLKSFIIIILGNLSYVFVSILIGYIFKSLIN